MSIDFQTIHTAALQDLPIILARWLPDGRVVGREYEARNPLRTARWADFACGDKGGDVISLRASLFTLSQAEPARHLATMVGVS